MKLVAVFLGLLAVCGVQAEDVAENEARLIANYQTTTFIEMSTITTVGHYTCAVSTASTACSGRKRRNVILDINSNSGDFNPNVSETLAGSLSATELEEAKEDGGKDKFFFTLWKTTTSTFTVTSTSFNRDITVSVSLLCDHASALYTLC
nr:uncharacterized protein LOC113828321 [Penaeus vannamei]